MLLENSPESNNNNHVYLLSDNSANDLQGDSNGQYPPCPSDYGPVPQWKPRPGWRDQFPAFTHNLNWADADGHQHSMTFRSDSLPDLLADLKILKAMIRASKAQAQAREPEPVPKETGDIPVCPIHKVSMERRQSRRTGGHYWCHEIGLKELCFGRKKS
jgi:hypothetical protein